MNAQRLRTVVIGFGRIASGYAVDPLTAKFYRYATHAQALKDHPLLDWIGVADPSPDALRQAREAWCIPFVCGDTRALAAACDPEIAVLATPPEARLAAIREFPSLRGVLVEKPLGRTAAEAEAFLAHCDAHGILVQVNYWRRADSAYRRLADGLLRELVGEPQAVFCVYGNGMRNNGTHVVDFLRMLLGEIATVHPMGPGNAHGDLALAGDLDVAFGLGMRCGAWVSCRPGDLRRDREVSFDFWGEKGRLAVMQEGLCPALFRAGPHRALLGAHEMASDRPERFETTVGEALRRMHDNLAEAVVSGVRLYSPGDSALASERAAEQVLLSLGSPGKSA